MIFNSYQYILFLPLVFLAYYLIPTRFRWLLLLGASYAFYMAWEPAYAVLILISTGVDYGLGRAMGKASGNYRKVLLSLSLITNLGLLAAFKYFDLIRTTVNQVLDFSGHSSAIPALDVLLPVGISFYTFQTLSYTIDVYRGSIKPERHLGYFALYVSFFPQLVAGPIERSRRLLPQFKKEYAFHYPDVVEGLRLILWGLFKKVVVADQLAVLVNRVYTDSEHFSGPVLVLATLCFAYQIYCDFSGYSDIAIGSARLFGIRLMQNFNRPYHAKNIADFWERWHISLSTWFRDYVYIPLGGNRCTSRRWMLNIVLVFSLSGLWHGAHWNFVIWGMIHAVLYLLFPIIGRVLERTVGSYSFLCSRRTRTFIQWGATFLSVNFAWIFFRAESFTDALLILAHIPQGWQTYMDLQCLQLLSAQLDISVASLLGLGMLLALLIVIERRQGEVGLDQWLVGLPRPLRWVSYALFTVVILNGGVTHEIPFVYFQF